MFLGDIPTHSLYFVINLLNIIHVLCFTKLMDIYDKSTAFHPKKGEGRDCALCIGSLSMRLLHKKWRGCKVLYMLVFFIMFPGNSTKSRGLAGNKSK